MDKHSVGNIVLGRMNIWDKRNTKEFPSNSVYLFILHQIYDRLVGAVDSETMADLFISCSVIVVGIVSQLPFYPPVW